MAVQEKKTAKGQPFAIIKLSDLSRMYELFIFSEILLANRDKMVPGNSFLINIVKEKMAKDSNLFINTYSAYTGLPLEVTRESHKLIKLGGILDREQVARLAEASFKQGVIQTDVTKQAADLFDDSLAREIRGRR